MRRRLLNQMLTEQEERNRSQAVLSVLIPAVNLSIPADTARVTGIIKITEWAPKIENDSAVFQGAAPSSPQGSVPPAPAAPKKRGPGRPRKQ